MRERSMCENRETPETPLPATVRDGRRRRLPSVRHARFRGVGRSHSTDEAGEQSRPKAMAESAEGRGSSKGTVLTVDHVPDSEPDQAGRIDGRATARTFRLRVRLTRAKSRMRESLQYGSAPWA